MLSKQHILIIIASVILAPIYYYETGWVLLLFWKNDPSRLAKVNTFASHEIKFSDRLNSCEDALLVESRGLAILACDPGRQKWNTVMGIFRPGPVESGHLYIYDYKSTDAAPPREIEFVDFEFASDFHSLGIAYDETTSRLLVASHRHDFPAVELFKLDLNLDKPTATHLLSIQHPLLHGPNAMVWINEHEFYATNDHHLLIRHHPFLSKLETALALPGGTVVHVDFASLLADPQGRAQASIVARVPFANGIDLLNETTAVVASTSRTRVYFYNITRPFSSPPIFKYLKSIKLPFLPDNLSISKDGALMMAGHPHPPSLDKFCKSRHICDNDADAQKSSELCATTVPAPSWVARWTEENGLENLYVDVEYPTSSTALWDPEGKIGIVTGLYAWGILVWRDV